LLEINHKAVSRHHSLGIQAAVNGIRWQLAWLAAGGSSVRLETNNNNKKNNNKKLRSG
jgi:hypothetical protein